MARSRSLDYDVKRSAMLRHAAQLFARHGYTGTSISMIADTCGVSKALVYHYYEDKEAVLFDILSTHLDGLLTVVETAAAPVAESSHRLFAIIEALLTTYEDTDAEHQVQIANLKLLPQEKQESLRAIQRRLVRIFADCIADAIPNMRCSQLIKPLTMSLFGILNWHYLWFHDGQGLSRRDYAQFVTQFVLAGGGALTGQTNARLPAWAESIFSKTG